MSRLPLDEVAAVAAALAFIVFVLGPMIDAGAQRSEDRARCLKLEQCR